MGTEQGGGRPDSNIPDAATTDQHRLQTFCRQLFRDMVKQQVLEEPLTAHHRRLLVRYGASLGLDELESALIVRAVEHECGRADLGEAGEVAGTADPSYLAEIDACRGLFLLAMIILAGVLLGMTLLNLR